MSGLVNLLLLLSALLSALTGVTGSARQPQVAQAVAQQVKAAAIASAALRIAARPVQALATLRASSTAPRARALAISAVEPLFAGRRRE
jgi:CBS domain containing-hemolysin-like protein